MFADTPPTASPVRLQSPAMIDTATPRARAANPWHALWALLVGFFMILVDATIVAVANPAIMDEPGRRLRRGHLGDQRLPAGLRGAAAGVPGGWATGTGPRTSISSGLAVFTAASLWCGLSDTIGMLVAARVVQGIGAALLTPQTLSVITRTSRRSAAVSR